MWPYWILFGFFAGGALVSTPDFRRSKPLGIGLLFGALVVLLFVGLRYKTGTDWGNYQRQWVAAENLTLEDLITIHNGDAGFYTLMWGLKSIGAQYWVLNLICAAIFACGLFAFAKRFPNPWLSLAIATPYLIIVLAMSGTRQATAVAFVLLALNAFSRRNTRAFLGWSAAATLFHASAVLTLPFAGLSFARTKFQAIVICLVIIILAWITVSSSFSLYSVRYLNETVQSSGLIFRVAMNAVAALIYLLAVRPRVQLEEHESKLWRNYSLFALGAVVVAVFFPTSTALDRTLIYVFPLQIYALSLLPYVSQRGSSPVLPIGAILLYLATILFVFLNFGVNAESYIPYRIYWPGPG